MSFLPKCVAGLIRIGKLPSLYCIRGGGPPRTCRYPLDFSCLPPLKQSPYHFRLLVSLSSYSVAPLLTQWGSSPSKTMLLPYAFRPSLRLLCFLIFLGRRWIFFLGLVLLLQGLVAPSSSRASPRSSAPQPRPPCPQSLQGQDAPRPAISSACWTPQGRASAPRYSSVLPALIAAEGATDRDRGPPGNVPHLVQTIHLEQKHFGIRNVKLYE